MTAREEVEKVLEEAKKLLDEREPVYGDSWRKCDFATCFEQIPRKARYLEVQYRNGKADTEKFREDLKDMINWCAFACIRSGEDEARS